jgi:hypothetical protein
MMADAPKKEYLDQDAEAGDGMFPRCFENPKYCSEPAVEYHRADMSADLVRAALERAADFISTHVYTTNGGITSMEPVAQKFRGIDQHHATISIAIRAIAKDDEAVEAIITSVLGEPT